MFVSCINNTAGLEDFDKAVYSFTDASVEPSYHRSYTIVVTNSEISITVDVYGTVIAEKSYSLSSNDFNSIKKTIMNAEPSNTPYRGNNGCAGGTGESLSLYYEDKQVFAGSIYHCGGKDSGNFKGDINSIKKVLISLIPDFYELLETEYSE
jgi:hypothetical protein